MNFDLANGRLASGWALLAVFVASVAAIALTNYYQIQAHPRVAFFVTLAVLVFSIAVIGMAVNGRPAGIVIDNRNRVSLSKFQATLWTVLVVAALMTIASHNLALDPVGNPLDFTIPGELLAAMGISAASFVATPMVLSLKAQSEPAPADARKAAAQMDTSAADPKFTGKLFGRTDPAGASWADMLRGDEVGNAFSTDLSKVQQLFISLVLVGIYGMAVLERLATPAVIDKLPPLNENFVWLMAISHASYIAYKAAPHTRDADGGQSGATDPLSKEAG